ncbi:peptidoglycan DD-metalloendopeptidase family protein [Chelatococcus sp. GCM10030263]|uniref:peptidoglycan DD-metalloendopeptidase family protein n=1 Tax=Chelatococcus sp. GCM10030263 TaxID=3273387 RepID=UPI00361D2F48
MRHRVASLRPRLLSRVAVVGLLASVASGCGTDTMRFVQNPFTDPFKANAGDQMATGSIGPSAPVGGASYGSPSAYPSRSAPVTSAPLAAPSAPRASVAPPEAVGGSAKGWTAQGGTPFVVGTGDTLAGISGRYNVPVAALAAANGLKGNSVSPGQQIIIPVYNPSAPQTVASRSAGSTGHFAAPPLTSQPQRQASLQQPMRAPARPTQVPLPPRHAAAKAVEPSTHSLKPVARAPEPVKEAAKPVEVKQSVAEKPAPDDRERVAVAKPAEPETTASLPKANDPVTDFRWPARGRVIQGFGGRGGNEGINIAVPEGTPVKAAEGGTVAYAGNELKGYGNLVLVRHEDGWVTAYANNSEILVKRGEKVKRGQTIAKSGQTGNVSSPQLHFELRKGSTPVDPMSHLAGL